MELWLAVRPSARRWRRTRHWPRRRAEPRRPRRPAFYSLHWAAAAKVPNVNELNITIALRTMAEANGVLCQVSHSLHWTAAAKVLDAKELDVAITLRAMAETNGVPFQDTGPFRSILLPGCRADGEDTGPYKSIQLRGCRAWSQRKA